MLQLSEEDATMEIDKEEVPELALDTHKTKAKGIFQGR